MDARRFSDTIRFARGFVSDNLGDDAEHGDAANGARNVIWDALGQPSSWRGASYARRPAAPLLHSVNNKLAGNSTGNIWQQHGRATWFIGSGKTYYNDFSAPIGVASSLLQVRIDGQTYQAGLSAPPAPLLSLGLDSLGQTLTGQVTGSRTAQLTRVRSVTGTESAASDPSNLVIFQNGRARIEFPAALTASGQDQWGLYVTEAGRGDIGPSKLLRYILEAEIAVQASAALADCPGDGATTIFGGLSSASTRARCNALRLAPSGGTAPVQTGVFQGATAGKEQLLRLQRPQGAKTGDFLVAGIAAKAVHQLAANANNKGSVTINAVTGGWIPSVDTIEIEVISTTQYRWRQTSIGTWSAGVNLHTSLLEIGTTSIAISWTATTTGQDEVGNAYVITPFLLTAPPGWTLRQVVADIPDAVTLYAYTKFAEDGDAAFDDWTANFAAQMYAVTGSYEGVHTSAPVTSQAFLETNPGTTHQVTFGAAPAATDRVVFLFAGVGEVAFTATSPLTLGVDSAVSGRVLDFDFTDSDLADILAPRAVSGPPAGTHGFPLGPFTVIAGTEDGTGLNISEPNQAELYDLTLTTYLNPAEPILRIDTRPHDGSVYIYTANSVQTPILSGNQEIPLICRALWPNTGIANPGAATLTDRGMYLYSAREGACRSSGYAGPDTSFARPVARYMRDNWNPQDVRVGYSQNLDAVAFCHRRELLLYFQKTNLWSLPLDLTDFIHVPGVATADCTVLSCVTLNGEMWMSIGYPLKGMAMHQAHVGPGSQWALRSVARAGNLPGYDKTVRGLRLTANLDIDIALTYTDFSNITEENGAIVANSKNAGGYCVAELMIAPAIEALTVWFFEFEITGLGKAREFVVANATDLTGANLAPLAWNSAPVQFGAQVDASNTLRVYTGATLTYGTVQNGDMVRVGRVGPLGSYGVQVMRAGVSQGVVTVTPPTVTEPLGIKITLAADSKLGPGRYKSQAALTAASVKLYRNRDAENGLAARETRNVFAAGNAEYDWGKVNVPRASTYTVEITGTGPDQDVSSLLVEGFSTMRKRNRRGGLRMIPA